MTLLDPVVLLVVAFQAVIFLRCNAIARADESDELNRLWNTFKHDIQSRAKRGDGPDWVRYMDEADRVHERRVDGMRVWATAALVVGIGGTMGALAYRLWGLSDFELGVLAAFAPALLASLSGVANNLLITLWLFGVSDGRFEQALNDFRQALRTCSDENAPEERFADAVRDRLGEAFREAVRSFPDAFAQLDRSVQHMGEAAAAQSRSTLEAAAGLQRGVEGLTAAAAQIAPAADLLNAATTDLRTMPGQLRQTLDEARTLHEEAQHLLAEYQRKQRDAAREAGQMIEQARIEAERIRAEATEALVRREPGDEFGRLALPYGRGIDGIEIAERAIVHGGNTPFCVAGGAGTKKGRRNLRCPTSRLCEICPETCPGSSNFIV